MAGVGSVPPKRKEIYKYEAPWTVFSMNWSVRPDKRFRLALGSFVEEYNNKVQVRAFELLMIIAFEHFFLQFFTTILPLDCVSGRRNF